ncbi:bifunctional aspartate kinase/homoserine dehydrogenase I [Succinivibrio dextrinosolvens]|uniref:bifunctional aspartate kinase/homoserine dehydrogenase I n=1 Tax=Succinivibrio dextrinosolvens TaxID=83771 RepID=UPI0004E261E9|nr:bifunctional aspartate kinase/homoserine dehydrogenase I [Succinivibrio dextrinosolvens]
MRVLKFGGTSVANAERFQDVAKIALDTAAHSQTALVLSAPAKITNLLVALVAQGAAGNSGLKEFDDIRAIIEPIITTLGSKFEGFNTKKILSEYNKTMETIRKRVDGMALLGVCPELVMAYIESRGESFSILIMEELLKSLGKKVRVIDPVKVLVTEGPIMESSVNIDASKAKYAALEDDKDAITLMSGFCGGNAQGELVLLGRNGSDYSAACLAAISNAECCEIWTDVDGVYSCDPRAVSGAILLRKMSYAEAMELSYFGAKVLHPRTIAPIAQFHIPCLIKNTKNPKGEGTLISEETDLSIPIKGISDLKGIALLNISGPGMKGMVGMAGRLFTAVSRANVSVTLITQSSSEYSISFCVNQSELSKAKRAITGEFKLELKEGLLNPIEVKEGCAIISVVGDGMRTVRGISGKFFRALAEANVNIRAIAQGSSERSISAVISQKRVPEAVAFAHTAFFNSKQRLDVVLLGCGGVGGALLSQIKRQREMLSSKQGIDIRVVGVGNSKHFISDPNCVDLENYQELLSESDSEALTPETAEALIKSAHLLNPILVDCTTSEELANSYIDYMKAGYHIVTPSKKANTLSFDFYRKLREASKLHHRKFLYEANVGAGLPVINTMQNQLAAGDELIDFAGILSGTLSFIFGLVEDGKTLSEATKIAYEKGFTEPNPADDLDGMDVGRKLLILARENGMELELSDVRIDSIVDPKYLKGSSAKEVIANLKNADAEFSKKVSEAKAKGKVLRYVGCIKDGKVFCQLREVGPEDPLFRVRDGENALALTTLYYQPIPLVIRGYGAGTEVTAAGVLSDVLRLQNWTHEE